MIADPKGYLFLDVDGVLNPVRGNGFGRPGWWLEDIPTGRGSFRVWIGEPLSIWLNQLIDSGIQIVWATTWITDQEALAHLADAWNLPDDLPQISECNVWENSYMRNCGKRWGVDEYITSNNIDPLITPVVWADDMIGPEDKAWANSVGVTAFAVPDYIGLADEREQAVILDALRLAVTT